jgi:hypothetical protein
MRKFLFAIFFTGAGAFAAMLMVPANALRYEVKTIWSRVSVKPAPEPVVEVPAGPVFNDTIEVQIYKLKNDAYGNVVQLEPKKKKNEYIVPVWIGSCEMDALNFKMRNQVASRPDDLRPDDNYFQRNRDEAEIDRHQQARSRNVLRTPADRKQR